MKNLLKRVFKHFEVNSRIIRLHKKAYNCKNKYLARYYVYLCYKKYNCCFAKNAIVGDNFKMPHPVGIVIGDGVIICNDVCIYQNVTIGQKNNIYPKIGNNVTIYAGAVIIGNVKVGNNVIIGANSVVTHDIPDGCVVAGVPAKIIKRNVKDE